MNQLGLGIFIGQASSDDLINLDQATLDVFEAAGQSHRDDYHFFIVQEAGDIIMEIDFQRSKVNGAAIIYIHPGQVHRMLSFKNIKTSFLAIRSESVRPEYLELLHNIAPAKPIGLRKEDLILLSEMVTLCMRLSERKDERLHHSFLKDSCNAFIGLVVSQYLKQSKSLEKWTRPEVINKASKQNWNTTL